MPEFNGIPVPSDGVPIQMDDDRCVVSDSPIVPFIEGDGTGRDIWKASRAVFDAAVEKAYGGSRRIAWYEILAGEKARDRLGEWLPADTVEAIREFKVAIKGPLTTPVGGGIRSLNVALRQILTLYSCVRPVKWYPGVPSPMKDPGKLDVVIFCENTEDVYAGIEWEQGTEDAGKLIEFLNGQLGRSIRADSGIGIKPVSVAGSKRLVRAAINYARSKGRSSVTLDLRDHSTAIAATAQIVRNFEETPNRSEACATSPACWRKCVRSRSRTPTGSTSNSTSAVASGSGRKGLPKRPEVPVQIWNRQIRPEGLGGPPPQRRQKGRRGDDDDLVLRYNHRGR